MGCSPSKGNNLSVTQGLSKRGKTLLPGIYENTEKSQCENLVSENLFTLGEAKMELSVKDAVLGDGCGGGKKSGTRLSCKETYLDKNSALCKPSFENSSSGNVSSQEIEISMVAQEPRVHGDNTDGKQDKRGAKRTKKVKGSRLTKKDRTASAAESKVDFPEPLVKAHQAAYAYLNPSISKYDNLLDLLDQAAETQLSLQTMVAFMLMRFEEINNTLCEISKEGERVLKENGDHLAWPCALKNLSTTPAKDSSTTSEPPPDLLQQLLQYTTQKMRMVSHSVSGIGDSALEEASDYFASVSALLEEKLKIKRASEARLAQVLTRIESAAFRRPGPEDSTLYSEDSGIGTDTWSLAGCDQRCESTNTNQNTPAGTNSTPEKKRTPRCRLTRKTSSSLSLNSIDSTCTITSMEQKETEFLMRSAHFDGEAEVVEENQGATNTRSRFHSSVSDSCLGHPCHMPTKRIVNPQNEAMTQKMKDAISGKICYIPVQRTNLKKQPESPKSHDSQWTDEGEDQHPKRPQTATGNRTEWKKPLSVRQRRSRSAESLRSKAEDPTLVELERSRKELSHKLDKMIVGESKDDVIGASFKRKQISSTHCEQKSFATSPYPSKEKSKLKCNSSGKVSVNMEEEKKKRNKKVGKGPVKAMPPMTSKTEQTTAVRKEANVVKRLIDTFSQTAEEKQCHASTLVLGPLRGVRKCGVPIIPGLPTGEAIAPANSFVKVQSNFSNRLEDLDLDDLPPPAPEVLMDTSFETAQDHAGDKEDIFTCKNQSPLLNRTRVSQRLRASIQPVAVLPNRGNLRGSPLNAEVDQVQQDSCCHECRKLEVDAESEETATLYRQARKVIHLQHSIESQTEKPLSDTACAEVSIVTSPISRSLSETTSSSPSTNSQPATPPALRTRKLPSTSSQPRRLPSPPTFKSQSTLHSSTSPPTSRKLPTPPSNHRRLPSPPNTRRTLPNSSSSVLKREVTLKSSTSYDFKVPSPPASPRVPRWTRDNSREERAPLLASKSRVCGNAHSVFCPVSPSLFEAQPCLVTQPTQAWNSNSSSTIPLQWQEPGRGRLPLSMRGPQPFIRRSHSERRSSHSVHTRTPTASIAHSCGSEPTINTQGLEDGPTQAEQIWGFQSDLRSSNRAVSHPDLCIVGHGLQRE